MNPYDEMNEVLRKDCQDDYKRAVYCFVHKDDDMFWRCFNDLVSNSRGCVDSKEKIEQLALDFLDVIVHQKEVGTQVIQEMKKRDKKIKALKLVPVTCVKCGITFWESAPQVNEMAYCPKCGDGDLCIEGEDDD